MDIVLSEAERMSALIERLRTTYRPIQPEDFLPTQVNNIIEDVCALISTHLRHNEIAFEFHPEPDLPLIPALADQIRQVIFSLLMNAVEAMTTGGTLTVYTKLLQDSGEILLSVSDTGIGMDKETLEHIFDPFFTTKDVGRGTGLGLSVVYGIVRQHGGHIYCETELGKGATFKVYFPVAEPDDGFSNGEEERRNITGGTETILLVDDEDFILELGQQILQQYGYRALTARTGKEALEIYRQQPGAKSLVLLDLIMPEMSGKQCMLEILKLNPHAKILISSGYASSGASIEAFDFGARGFVSKPFDVAQLLKQVRKTLDSA